MLENITDDPIFLELQFTQAWIDLGIITSELFEKIRAEYLKGEDPSSEHYRWGAFRIFLTANHSMSKEIFLAIYELGVNDPDYPMGRAMRFDLIKRSDCPMELIEAAIHGGDQALAKHALKYRDLRGQSS